MSISAEGSPKARIVAAVLRDRSRILLCHRSPGRRWYPDVWDLPGGHVEPGELPAAALARELHEELGIDIAAPSGSPANAAPDEHDAIAWFTEDALGDLSLAHDGYLALFSTVLAERVRELTPPIRLPHAADLLAFRQWTER